MAARAKGSQDGPKRRPGLLAGVLLLGSALWLVAFLSPASLAESQVHVAGRLRHGSLERRGDCDFRFVLEREGTELPVVYSGCQIPDTLRDRPRLKVEVTAQGKLGPRGVFEAEKLVAKAGGPYEVEERAVKPYRQ